MFLCDFAEFNNLVKRLVPVKGLKKTFMAIRYVNPNKGLISPRDIGRVDKVYRQVFNIKGAVQDLSLVLKGNPQLTPTEAKAMSIYMFGDYRAINAQLRSGGEIAPHIASINKVINNSLVKYPVLPKKFNESGNLVRFTGGMEDIKVGDKITSKNLMSTSMTDDRVDFAINNIYQRSSAVMLIEPRKNSKARIVEGVRDSYGFDEKEVIYPVGTKFQVTDVFDNEPYQILLENPPFKPFSTPTPDRLKKELIDDFELEPRHLKRIIKMREI
jgi:hypothetical protein